MRQSYHGCCPARNGADCERLPGFTLIEILVAIAVVAVLLAIAAPVLSSARKSAIEAAAMSHQRDVGSMVLQYSTERRDRFPSYGIPGTNRALLCFPAHFPMPPGWTRPEPGHFCVERSYWEQPYFWAIQMSTDGYDMEFAAYPPELPELVRDMPTATPSIDQLTFTAFAPPRYWRPEAERTVEDHYVQRWSDVAAPSQKVILQRWNFVRMKNAEDPGSASPVVSWFADGHGRRLRLSDLRRAAPAPNQPPNMQHDWPGMTTVDGLNGRDI